MEWDHNLIPVPTAVTPPAVTAAITTVPAAVRIRPGRPPHRAVRPVRRVAAAVVVAGIDHCKNLC